MQETDANGLATFTSIYPACYPGRWPHIHFEVYPNLKAITEVDNKIATSQIALPEDTSNQVYSTSVYEQSIPAMADVSLSYDGVFGEDCAAQHPGTIDGSVEEGFTVSLTIAV